MFNNWPNQCFTVPTESLVLFDCGEIVRINLELLETSMDDNKICTIANYYLGEEEKKKFYSFQYEKRRTEWLGGRIAAKKAIQHLQYKKIQKNRGKSQWEQIKTSSSGKPYASCNTSNNTPIFISISHCRKWAVATASYKDCGIDVQVVTEKVVRVQQRFVTDIEKAILEKNFNPDRLLEALTLLWSAKEAVKKTGNIRGLTGFLDIKLESLAKFDDIFVFKLTTTDPQQYKIVKAKILDNYSYAVTFKNHKKMSLLQNDW